jgi:hypothetical protein
MGKGQHTGRIEIYGLHHPETGELRYIGKANNAARRLSGHLRDQRRRNTPLYCWIRKLTEQNLCPEVQVLLVCEPDAWERYERALIAQQRAHGARLLNLADGGDQPYCPPEARARHAQKMVAASRSLTANLIKFLGLNARYFDLRGDHARAARQRRSQDTLRAMTPEHRANFEREWIAAGNHCPGGSHG